MPGNYAKGTEIERTLTRFGCNEFAYMLSGAGAAVVFTYRDRQVRFVMKLPDRKELRFNFTEARRLPVPPERHEALYEQAVRERWRALAAGIKAKLAMV